MRKPLLLAAAIFAFPGRALASEPPLFDSAPLDDEELAAARGGFTTLSGVQIDFGATLTTTVDGVRQLQTTMQLSQTGLVSTSVRGPDIPIAVEGSHDGAPSQGVRLTVGTSPNGPPASLVASVEQSDLLIRHMVDDQISSLIVNTGDNRVIENDLTINLRLSDVPLLSLGSLGGRIDAMAMDAASFRGP